MKFKHKARVLSYVKYFLLVPQLDNWPYKLIIVNISKTIKDIIKILTAHKTNAQGARIKLYKKIFVGSLIG